MNPTKPIILSLLFCLLVWFVWSFNLKPLFINKEVNLADHYVKTDQCEKALEKMKANVLSSQSIIDSYTKLKYIDIIGKCNAFSPKAISVLKQAAEIRPHYTRTWIFLGTYTNVLIKNSSYFKVKNIEELKKQAYSYFEKANQLSPKREQVFVSWLQTDLFFEEYQKAKEKAEQCINSNPKSDYCWWIRGISNLYLGEVEQSIRDIEMAHEQGLSIHSEKYISQFTTACEKNKNAKCFEKLTDVYHQVVVNHNYELEYSLHLIYISSMGEKEEILKEYITLILERWPELESELRNTLKSVNEYTNKINMQMVKQYINNSKKISEILNVIMSLPKSELRKSLSSQYEYLDEINKQIKLIKSD